MSYGKALGTYRRINRIRNSAQKIAEASQMMEEQKRKAYNEMVEMQERQNLFSGIAQAGTTAATAGMSIAGVDPDLSAKISAGTGFATSVGGRLAAGGLSDDAYAGLGQRGITEINRQSDFNPFDDAATAYATDQSFAEIRRLRNLNKAIEEQPWGEEWHEYGFTPEQLKETAMSDPKMRDFSDLPMRTLERQFQHAVGMGQIEPTSLDIDEEEKLGVMRNWWFDRWRKGNQRQ